MKNFLSLAKERCSVRKYKNTPVETEKLEAILEACRIAPSACNYQPWIFERGRGASKRNTKILGLLLLIIYS